MLCGKLGMLAVNFVIKRQPIGGKIASNLIISNRNTFQLLETAETAGLKGKVVIFIYYVQYDFENIMN